MNNQPNESTISLQSTTTVSSTTPLRQPPQPQKDYSAAFGVLQSRYGTGGALPNPKKKPSKKLPETLSESAEPTPSSFSAPASLFESSEATLGTQSNSSIVSQSQSEGSAATTESTAESSASGSNSGSSTGGQTRKKKEKKSILKTLLKGKKKDAENTEA